MPNDLIHIKYITYYSYLSIEKITYNNNVELILQDGTNPRPVDQPMESLIV
jgi:hypothetical protein